MYSIGSEQRFRLTTYKTECSEAFYSGPIKTENIKKGQSIGRHKRETILSYGVTDNKCDAIYLSPDSQNNKNLAKSQKRLLTLVPKFQSASKQDLHRTQTLRQGDNLVLEKSQGFEAIKKSAPKISFPVNTKRVFADIKEQTQVPGPATYFPTMKVNYKYSKGEKLKRKLTAEPTLADFKTHRLSEH